MTDPNEQRDLLLTGATGFLGGEILVRLLQGRAPAGGPGKIYLLVRATDAEDANRRVRGMLASLLGRAEPYSERVVAIAADITRPGLGIERSDRENLAERVGRIIHCAASVSFSLSLQESRAINVEGTRRMLDLAELASERGGIDSFCYVSTAYVAGTHRGDFGEADLDRGQGFHNPYERSKFEAEALVHERAERTRAQILRPSIVVGDSASGWTRSFNVIYAPLRAFSRGALPILPARRSSPVDVVPVDFVADAVLALAGRPGTTYNLTAGERASSVGGVVDLACETLALPPPRMIPAALYRSAVHPILLRSGSERRRRALRSSEVFFPYFSLRARYDNSSAQAALRPLGIEPPALDSYFDRLLRFADAAAWGKRPIARHTISDPPDSRPPRRDRQMPARRPPSPLTATKR